MTEKPIDRLLTSDFYDVSLRASATRDPDKRARLYRFSIPVEIRLLFEGYHYNGGCQLRVGDLLLWKDGNILFMYTNNRSKDPILIYFNAFDESKYLFGCEVVKRYWSAEDRIEIWNSEPLWSTLAPQLDFYYDLITSEPEFAKSTWLFHLNLRNEAAAFERHFGHAPPPGWGRASLFIHDQKLVDLRDIHFGTCNGGLAHVIHSMPHRTCQSSFPLAWRDIVDLYYETTDSTVTCFAMIIYDKWTTEFYNNRFPCHEPVFNALEEALLPFFMEHSCLMTFRQHLAHNDHQNDANTFKFVHHLELAFEARRLVLNTGEFERRLRGHVEKIDPHMHVVHFYVQPEHRLLQQGEFRRMYGSIPKSAFEDASTLQSWPSHSTFHWYSQHQHIVRMMLALMPMTPHFLYGGFYYRKILLLVDELLVHTRPARFIGLIDGMLASYRRVLDARTKHTRLRSGRLLPKLASATNSAQ